LGKLPPQIALGAKERVKNINEDKNEEIVEFVWGVIWIEHR
jgi:hypothetical protein